MLQKKPSKEISGNVICNRSRIWNSVSNALIWMILQRGGLSYRQVATAAAVQAAETTAVQSGWGTGFADRVGRVEERGKILCLCPLWEFLYLQVGQQHDTASSGSPHHGGTKWSHSKGHFLNFLYHKFLSLLKAVFHLLFLCVCH